jgi:hypothetical protein
VEAEEEKDKPEPLAPIDIGGVLPALTLKNEKDEDIQVADLASEKGVVMFLVPKADTRELRPKHAPSPFRKANHWARLSFPPPSA